jgi:hypothetical protein
MKRLAAAGITLLALAALAIARRRAAKCPWTAADAKYVRDGVQQVNRIPISDAGPETFTGRTVFASLDRGNDR